jgi:hypothetical protein
MSRRVVFAATWTPAARSSWVAFWEVAVPNTGPSQARDAGDLVAAPVRARNPRHAELCGQLALHRSGRDRLQGAEDRAQARGVKRAPFAVARGPGDPGDLVVNVILRVAVPAGALQPRGDDHVRLLKPAGLAAVDAGAVVAGAGDTGPCLQVLKSSPVGAMQDLLELLLPPGPVRGGPLVSGEAGAALVLTDRGVQHRDGLGERDGDVGVGGGLAGRLGGLAFQLDEPLGGGVRLGGAQPGQVTGEGGVAAAGTAELAAGTWVDLLVDRLVRLALDDLAGVEAEGLYSWSPPLAGRFPGQGGVEVVTASGASGSGLGLYPDVAEVVALGDGDNHGQPAASFPTGIAGPRDRP